MTPVFIVGTGRCGSTMLSNFIHQHDQLLSFSQFFATMMVSELSPDNVFPKDDITENEFWALLSCKNALLQFIQQHDIRMPELLYPCKNELSRFSCDEGVPNLLQIALPHLSDDFDALYVELGKQFQSNRSAGIRQHYDKLFDILCTRFNKKQLVERSGASMTYLSAIYHLYPESKYVHIARDGRNVSCSMTNQLGFRMASLQNQMTTYLEADPFISNDRSRLSALPEDLRCLLPENFDMQAFLDYRQPIEVFGNAWSKQIEIGMATFKKIPEEQKLTLYYDEICQNPENELSRLFDFIGVETSDSWMKTICEKISPSSSSWTKLPKADQEALIKACAVGDKALADNS